MKKKICIISGFFKPGYLAGGPIQSVYNLSVLLKEDYDIYIITRNYDLGGKPYENIKTNVWLDSDDGFKVLYLTKRDFLFKNMKISKSLNVDWVYLNSFFSQVTILNLISNILFNSKNLIVAPRGEFDSGALNLKKYKKKFFLSIFKFFNSEKNIFHATTDIEKLNIKAVFKHNEVFVAENIPKLTNNILKKVKKNNETNVLFISRISRKKNLKFCFDFFNKYEFEGEINFRVVGPKEDVPYWEECVALSKTFPENVSFSYLGEVNNANLSSVFEKAHLMFFPTLGENFGHVIYESLSFGVPVLISDRTPWDSKGNENGVFSCRVDDFKVFKEYFVFVHELDNQSFEKLSKNAYNYAKEKIDLNKIKKQYITMFNNEK